MYQMTNYRTIDAVGYQLTHKHTHTHTLTDCLGDAVNIENNVLVSLGHVYVKTNRSN